MIKDLPLICFSVSLFLSLSNSKAADPATPTELLKLRESYEAEIIRVTEPTKRRYLDALKRLQEHYTKSGDLEKALMVREEMQTADAASAKSGEAPLTTRDLEGTEWLWGSGGTLKLDRGGKVTHTAWSTPGEWKRINDVTITVQRPGGDPPMTVVFSDQGLTDAVITSHLGTSTTLKRVVK